MAEHRSDSEPESDIDAETLQARIDMSMAYAQDIVSGWMNASGTYASSSIPLNGSGSSGKKRDVEKELEEMMKRPPRYVCSAFFDFGYTYRRLYLHSTTMLDADWV